MTARAAPRSDLALITHEEEPLAVFGGEVSGVLRSFIEDAGIELLTSTEAIVSETGGTVVIPGRRFQADAIVSLPQLIGPYLDGLPADQDGFITTDEYMAVDGVAHVFAAGDCTAQPIKQGGLATQQADIAAIGIAQRAGAHVFPHPFRRDLYAKLQTTGPPWYFGRKGDEPSYAWEGMPAWPPSKVDGSYLAPWLAHDDAIQGAAHA
jgi:sulfide:quinone oxidoreductase